MGRLEANLRPTWANLGQLVAARLVAARLVAARLVAARLVAASQVAARGRAPAKLSSIKPRQELPVMYLPGD